ASYRHTRLEQLTLIGLIFDRNAHGHRLQALKARRRLKMSALLAAVQRSPAFGTLPLPIRVGRKRRGTVKTTSGYDVLKQTGQAGARDVQRKLGAGGFRPVARAAFPGVALGIHITALSVFTVVVH